MASIRDGDDISAVAPVSWNSSTNEISFDDFELSVSGQLPGTNDCIAWDAETRELTFDESKFWPVYVYPSYPEVGSFIHGRGGSVSVLTDTFNFYRTIDPEDSQDIGFGFSIDEDGVTRAQPLGQDASQQFIFHFGSGDGDDVWKFDETSITPLGEEDKFIGTDDNPLRSLAAVQFNSPRWANIAFEDALESAIYVNRQWDNNDVENLTFPPVLHLDLKDDGDGENENFQAHKLFVISVDNSAVANPLGGAFVKDRFFVDAFGDVHCRRVYANELHIIEDPWGVDGDETAIINVDDGFSQRLEPVTSMTGTANSNLVINTETVETNVLARRVKFLQEVMERHGMLAPAEA